jgi:hypothetical protein
MFGNKNLKDRKSCDRNERQRVIEIVYQHCRTGRPQAKVPHTFQSGCSLRALTPPCAHPPLTTLPPCSGPERRALVSRAASANPMLTTGEFAGPPQSMGVTKSVITHRSGIPATPGGCTQ